MSFKKDDKVTFVIEDIGTGGEGIGKVDGYTLFVKDAIILRQRLLKPRKITAMQGLKRLLRLHLTE